MPIFPTVIASILYIGRPVVGNAAYLSPFYCLLPSVLGNSQVISHCPPWAVFLVPGMSSLMIPVQVIIFSSSRTLSPASSCRRGGLPYYYTCPDFIPFPCINHLSISSSITEPVHNLNPRPIVAFLSFSPSYFLCFLCVLVISSLGRG